MNRFQRDVIASLGDGDWSYTSGFFYRKPSSHIMTGFMFETTPFSYYISRFCLPICDRISFISLGFSNRLPEPDGYVPRVPDPDRYVPGDVKHLSPSYFVQRIRPYIAESLRFSDMSFFLKKFSNETSLYSPFSRRGYATVLIESGDFVSARRELETCIKRSTSQQSEEFVSDTKELLQRLIEDQASAVQLLDSWEAETRAKFDIE